MLADDLRKAGQSVVLTREPGGTVGAEAIRDLLVNGEPDRWSAWSEACLVTAARVDHVARVIRPALARGDWIICDRYFDSTRAYQGAGKGIADADLCSLHAHATGDLWPDLTIILSAAAGVGLERAGSRGGGEGRFEAHQAEFHARVTAFFNALPTREPKRCIGFDATLAIAELAARIQAHVRAHLLQ